MRSTSSADTGDPFRHKAAIENVSLAVFMDGGVVEECPSKEVLDAPGEERTRRFLRLVLEH